MNSQIESFIAAVREGVELHEAAFAGGYVTGVVIDAKSLGNGRWDVTTQPKSNSKILAEGRKR